MKDLLLVGFGGFFGSSARYLVGAYFLRSYPTSSFPYGTFAVNILGCLLIGFFAAFTERLTYLNHEVRLLAITGFLGGFTTFSAFSIESLHMLRDGAYSAAALYIGSSVLLGIFCAYLGLKALA